MASTEPTPADLPAPPESACASPAEGAATPSGLLFSMAYQPIVDVRARRTLAYEALVRGVANQPAATVLRSWREAEEEQAAQRDLICGALAIETAAALGLAAKNADLFLNFSPNHMTEPRAMLASLLRTAALHGVPAHRLVLEITESKPVVDPARLQRLLEPYRALGVRTAIDDFGAGFAGLSTLAAFQPDLLKIDIALVREVHLRPASRVIVKAIVEMGQALNIGVIAEGIEQAAQMEALCQLGLHQMQGNLFAAPAFEALPVWPPAV